MTTNGLHSFQHYRQMVFALSGDLRQLRACAGDLQLDDAVRQAEDILQRIESHSFSIAVVGEFKRGKSTFINALLGREVLPAGVLPTSATLNRVTFGLKPGARIFFKTAPGEPERVEDVAIDQLAAYVTKLTPEAEAMAATVREAVVYYPVPYCKHNVDIVDTPGLSEDPAMTAITLDALPQVDTAVMLVMADALLSASEGDFVERLLERGLDRGVFVVTALDRIDGAEQRRRVVENVTQRIVARVQRYAESKYGKDSEPYRRYLQRCGRPRVFGLSGQQALQAKQTNDDGLLAESGFPALEATLEKLLAEESDSLALRARVAQIDDLCRTLLAGIETRAGGLPAQRQAFAERSAVLGALLETLQAMAHEALRQVDLAAARASARVQPQVEHWEARLQQAVGQAINSQALPAAELEDPARYPALAVRLSARLSDEANEAARRLVEPAHAEIQDELSRARTGLDPFGVALERILQHVDAHWPAEGASRPGGDEGTARVERSLEPGQLVAALSLPPGWIEAALAAPAVQTTLAVPPNEGFFARTTRQMMLGSCYKTALARAAAAEMAGFFSARPVRAAVQDRIGCAFDALRQEATLGLERVESRLDGLKRHGQRLDVAAEHERRNLDRMRAEVEAARSRAQQVGAQVAAQET